MSVSVNVLFVLQLRVEQFAIWCEEADTVNTLKND